MSKLTVDNTNHKVSDELDKLQGIEAILAFREEEIYKLDERKKSLEIIVIGLDQEIERKKTYISQTLDGMKQRMEDEQERFRSNLDARSHALDVLERQFQLRNQELQSREEDAALFEKEKKQTRDAAFMIENMKIKIQNEKAEVDNLTRTLNSKIAEYEQLASDARTSIQNSNNEMKNYIQLRGNLDSRLNEVVKREIAVEQASAALQEKILEIEKANTDVT